MAGIIEQSSEVGCAPASAPGSMDWTVIWLPRVFAGLVLTLLAAQAAPASAQGSGVEPYAVVVHPSLDVENVSLDQLRKHYLGDAQFWRNRTRVSLLVHAPGAPERDVVIRVLYRMTDPEFKRYWVAKTFRNETAAGPKIVSSSAMALGLVGSVPGAVAVVPLSAANSSVRILRIDGQLPTDPG